MSSIYWPIANIWCFIAPSRLVRGFFRTHLISAHVAGQQDNSQTTGWRWTQPAQSSLPPIFSTHVSLTPHCLLWFSPHCPWQLSHSWALIWKEWDRSEQLPSTAFLNANQVDHRDGLVPICQELHTLTTVLRRKGGRRSREMLKKTQAQ